MDPRTRHSTEGALPKGPKGIFQRLSIRKKRRKSEPPARPRIESKPEEEADSFSEASDGSPETRRRRHKHWAHYYVNEPLNAPEPSQLTGPGSSFVQQHHPRSQSHPDKGKRPATVAPATPVRGKHRRSSSATRTKGSPIPSGGKPPLSNRQDKLDEQKLVDLFGFDPSCPDRDIRSRRISTSEAREPVYSSFKARTSKSNSAEIPRATKDASSHIGTPKDRKHPPIAGLRTAPGLHRSQSLNSGHGGLSRNRSLSERYPGDMSQRPLDQIKREVKAANRAPHLRKNYIPPPDMIDALDDVGIGGAYHHGGPFDATLASRNKNKKYAPVEAVKETNMKALKATPYEYVQDSLQRHMPLQGTATVPSGQEDMFGRRMSYEEGADVMREADAPGGAYKRYDHILYHPDDLKGKGEPSFTIEREAKEQKRRRKQAGYKANGAVYEMQPTRHSRGHENGSVRVRERSGNLAGPSGSQSSPGGNSKDADVRPGSNTGKRLSDGIKRRIDSIRRKYDSYA
ncbi:hypothetical protein DL766_001653 [Monosporascus sp. MC13-8B]|uniref:Pal1 cell morphology protein n=1 Tax=Monosporascus cannonballus TaxID=155416 RepID=A0ABY0GYD3_9PEZI|nr:hypothetical protein DL762_007692 [Monosporascus cannonballus]RYO91924.1 hypothetical protein DL763_004862 [Monosporascus cannonballus]RYP37079.1 hypothetical protein DL766_001653 [Monosporascus sp. MC13-8B]